MGVAILELIYAAYHSAFLGQRVYLPFRPKGIERAVDLYLEGRPQLGTGPVNDFEQEER